MLAYDELGILSGQVFKPTAEEHVHFYGKSLNPKVMFNCLLNERFLVKLRSLVLGHLMSH